MDDPEEQTHIKSTALNLPISQLLAQLVAVLSRSSSRPDSSRPPSSILFLVCATEPDVVSAVRAELALLPGLAGLAPTLASGLSVLATSASRPIRFVFVDSIAAMLAQLNTLSLGPVRPAADHGRSRLTLRRRPLLVAVNMVRLHAATPTLSWSAQALGRTVAALVELAAQERCEGVVLVEGPAGEELLLGMDGGGGGYDVEGEGVVGLDEEEIQYMLPAEESQEGRLEQQVSGDADAVDRVETALEERSQTGQDQMVDVEAEGGAAGADGAPAEQPGRTATVFPAPWTAVLPLLDSAARRKAGGAAHPDEQPHQQKPESDADALELLDRRCADTFFSQDARDKLRIPLLPADQVDASNVTEAGVRVESVIQRWWRIVREDTAESDGSEMLQYKNATSTWRSLLEDHFSAK